MGIGSVGDAAVVTDADGTLSSYLRGIVKLLADGITVALSTVDIQIGAVELKNATTDDRAAIKTASTAADTDIGVVVADPNLDAKIPALGAAAAAAAIPITLATEDAAKVAALGVAASAASSPVVLASDDAHLGSVGAAADVDGNIHGQLRYIGEAVSGGVSATTSAVTSVSGSASSVTLLALNAARTGASIHNDSTAILYVKLGATASTSSYTVRLDSQDHYEVPFDYTGVIDGIWDSAAGNARITEFSA